MISNRRQDPSHAGKPGRFRPLGFTIVSTAVSLMVAGIMLAGGWMSYSSMLRQWKIGNAEREMDRYAAAAMQEMTNDLSWSWGGAQLQGGPRNTRWKFMMADVVNDPQENYQGRTMDLTWLGHLRDQANFVVFTFQPTLGILISNQVPPWAGDRFRHQYQFVGTVPHRDAVNSFDQRDLMTVEGLTMDFNTAFSPAHRWNTIQEEVGRQGVVQISMTMQYTYRGRAGSDLGVFGDYYVRERQYSTQVSMRNWDTDDNAYKDSLVAHAG